MFVFTPKTRRMIPFDEQIFANGVKSPTFFFSLSEIRKSLVGGLILKGRETVCSKEVCFDVKIPCDGIKLTGRSFILRNG